MERKAVRKNTVCLNCGNTFKGEFCPHCGQNASTKRLKITETAADFVNSFVGGDNKFMRTCIDLFTRPGYMVRDYLLGKRVRYYNPLQLFLFLLTVFAIFSVALVGIPPFGPFLSKWLTGWAAAANGGWAGHLGTASLIASAVLAMLYTQSVVVRIFFPLRTASPAES